ncbi:MAG: hypothetical protein ACOCQX_01800 [Candidatus Nanoarchaeia archaeon]
MDIAILFRLTGIFVGILLGVFSTLIFINTRGGSKGWKYIAGAGVIFFLWSITQLIFTMFYEWYEIKVFMSFITWVVVGTFMPLGYMRLGLDFGQKMPRFFSPKPFLITVGVLWALLLILNLVVMPFTSILQEIAGVAHIIMTVMLWAGAVYPVYLLWKASRNWVWLFLLLFAVFLPIGSGLGSYSHACCSHSEEQFEDACAEISVHYADVVYLPCSQGALGVAKLYNLIELPFIVLLAIGHIGIWKQLR